MASLLIATPCYGKVVGEGYLQSLLSSIDLLRQNNHQVKVYTLGNESLITRARNNIVAYFVGGFVEQNARSDAGAPLAALQPLHDHRREWCFGSL